MEAKELFGSGTSYTYDDVIFHPSYIDFAADKVRTRQNPADERCRVPGLYRPKQWSREQRLPHPAAARQSRSYRHANLN